MKYAARTLCSLVVALTMGACASARNSLPDNHLDTQPTVSYEQGSSEDDKPEISFGFGVQYHPKVLTFQFRDQKSGYFTRKNVGLYLPSIGRVSASVVDITKKSEGDRIFGFGGINLQTDKLARLGMFDVTGGINFAAFDGVDPFEGRQIAFKEYSGMLALESDLFDLQTYFSYNTSGGDNLMLSLNPSRLSLWLLEFNSSLQGRLVTRGEFAGDFVLRSVSSAYLSLGEFHFGPLSFGPFKFGPELVCIAPLYMKSDAKTSCIPAFYVGTSLKAGL